MLGPEQILSYIKEQEPVTANCSDSLLTLLETYPYFQTAHYLYLKALKQGDELPYREQLAKTVFHTTDRPHLYRYLQAEAQAIYPSVEECGEKKQPQLSMIDTFLTDFQAVNNGELLYTLPVDVMAELKEMPDIEPVQQKQDQKQNEWIDRFIQADQTQGWRSIGAEIEKKEDVAEPNPQPAPEAYLQPEPEEGALSESLARIYIKQKKYGAALEIIKKLSLKYPEKNIYFADQIRFLEKLIINIKS